MGSMTALRRWERALLALVHDTSESEFESVALYVGPILIPGFTDAFKTAIVRTALQHGYAITIDREIWFPSALDTSTLSGVSLLVHESVHVVDYAAVGIEAFLKSYVVKAIRAGFNHDAIPDERRANRIEAATRRMIERSPQLLRLIQACDGDAIRAELQRSRTTYRAELARAFGETADRDAAEEDRGGGRRAVDEPPAAADAAIDAQIRAGTAENGITDAVFFARNPQLPRRPLTAGTAEARQWQAIRDGEVRPAMQRMLRRAPADPALLATFLSQWEGDRYVTDEANEAFLTGAPLLSMARTLRDRVLFNWRAGHPPLTTQRFYDLALGVAGDPATALLLAHNVSRAFVRSSKALQWANGPRAGEYLIDTVTITAKVVHPAGRLTYARGGKEVRSIFYLLFSEREFGTEDPGDWYHYFVTATMAMSGATWGRGGGRSAEADAEDRTGPTGRVIQGGYALLLATALADLESQLTAPAFRGAPGYRGWVLANAISFLEGGFYGEDDQARVSAESRSHLRGALFGLRAGGFAANPAWRWYVPVRRSVSTDDLITGFSVRPRTFEVLDPQGRRVAAP
jgi:hypothetical protein